jgi:hypothetical protein
MYIYILYESTGSLPRSKEPVTGPHPEAINPVHTLHSFNLTSILKFSSHPLNDRFPSGLPNKILHAFMKSPMHSICPVHPILMKYCFCETKV